MKPFNTYEFIRSLIAIKERQRQNEQKAARLILDTLNQYSVPFAAQTFRAKTPVALQASLMADGVRIPAVASCFVSGQIKDRQAIVSSLIDPERLTHDSNINFNPECRSISRSSHYFAPSVAIAARDLPRILAARRVSGRVSVRAATHVSMNILVGNRTTPRHVLFCHYDSFGPGATDNAAGTAVLMQMAIERPQLLESCLFVISGNEELSYDKPIYWGHGYRVFERAYRRVLERAKTITIVDCVGNGKTTIDRTPDMLRMSLPLKSINRWMKKTRSLYGNIGKLMHVYHSDLDTLQTVQPRFLADAVRVCLRICEVRKGC